MGRRFFLANVSILLTLLVVAWHTRNHLFKGEFATCCQLLLVAGAVADDAWRAFSCLGHGLDQCPLVVDGNRMLIADGVSTQSLEGLDPLGSTLSDDTVHPNLLAINSNKYAAIERSFEDPKS